MGNTNAMQKLIDLANRIKNESLETSNTILDLVKRNYSPKIESVIKEYDLDRNEKFNIFETISDLYKREKFHSDILYSILAKETPEIGSIHNYEILTEFIKMIDETLDFVIDDTIEISKEEYNVVWDGNADKEGYVDILIKNGHNQAIIIENKINDAPVENENIQTPQTNEVVKQEEAPNALEELKQELAMEFLQWVAENKETIMACIKGIFAFGVSY